MRGNPIDQIPNDKAQISKEPGRVILLAEIASSPSAPRNDKKEESLAMVGKQGLLAKTGKGCHCEHRKGAWQSQGLEGLFRSVSEESQILTKTEIARHKKSGGTGVYPGDTPDRANKTKL